MKKGLLAVLCGVLIFGVCGPSQAELIFQLNQTYSGTSPTGPAPWLIATFQDAGANTVSLTLNASGLRADEFVSSWYFNIAPGFGEAILPNPDTGAFNYGGQYSAGSAQGFDIQFVFPTSNANRFGAGDSITYSLQGEGLDESDFNYLNNNGLGLYYSAAHVQSIGLNGESGWIATGGSNTTPSPSPSPPPCCS